MVDYENCIHCDCYNSVFGEAERHGQTIDACMLCEISEDELQEMAEWYHKNHELRIKGNEADDLSSSGNDKR